MNVQYADQSSAAELLARHAGNIDNAYRHSPCREEAYAPNEPHHVALLAPGILTIVAERASSLPAAPQEIVDANGFVTQMVVDLIDVKESRLLARLLADEVPLGRILDTFTVQDIAYDFDRHSLNRSEAFAAVCATSALAEHLRLAEQRTVDFTLRFISALYAFEITNQQEETSLEKVVRGLMSYQPSRYSFALMNVSIGYSPVLVGRLNFHLASNAGKCIYRESPTYARSLVITQDH